MRLLSCLARAGLLLGATSLPLPAGGGRLPAPLAPAEAAAQSRITLVVPANPVLVDDTMTVAAAGAATSGSIVWSTTGAAVAVVDSSLRTSRTFRFLSGGTLRVAVRDTNTASDTARIFVLGLSLDPDPLNLTVGETRQVVPRFVSAGPNSVRLSWSSLN
ncbi:MAG TPA: hypothetical protein VFR37_02450, partial [Longimicrobium sp.]|nr:hypothetical protein [Longimicrobium sp.]